MHFQRLIKLLAHEFANIALLQQALTHRSFGSPNNERLEFLGDSVLNCCVAKLLYERFPKLSEGELSRVRASLVKQQSLADIAQVLSLGDYLKLGEGELKSGGFRRPSILADALEAIFGAVLLDSGFDAAFKVIAGLYTPIIESIDPLSLSKDPKTRLQEWLQGRRMNLPQYQLLAMQGEAHDQRFDVECQVSELSLRAVGSGGSRRAAEQDAARQIYDMIAAQGRK